MIDRDIKKKDLKDMTGLSYGTIAKLEKGNNVEISVLDKICVKLKCQLSDIAEITFD
jgi:DNA-binding Xre family transcriptional regulator